MKILRTFILTIALCLGLAVAVTSTASPASAASCAYIYHPSEHDTSAGCVGMAFGYQVQATQVCKPVTAWQPAYTMYGNKADNGVTSYTFSCGGTVTSYGYRIIYVGI